ncbi:MAG TPA: hypothetical protein VFA34_14525 [Actinomycetota bacterium]|jgi:parvulin-like peptidyl-prolyl isomerase|nr:hypothetical protein [Actinomycetota bacterium]
MERVAGRTAFSVGAREYGWVDVVLAAHLWGEYANLERWTRAGIACQKRLRRLGQAVPEDEVDEASDAWRYERDLLSADEAQEWLDERGLNAEEWVDYIERTVLRQRWASELDKITKAESVTAREVSDALYAEAVCSGALGELGERLAAQAAIYDRVAGSKGGRRPPGCSQAAVASLLKRLPATVKKTGVAGLTPGATSKRAELLACLAIVFERHIDEIAAPAALDREIEAHALDWTRIDCEQVLFADEGAAREVLLLIREDGLPLSKAAGIAKAPVEKSSYVLDDVDPSIRLRLVGALPGQVIGPIAAGDGYYVVSIVDRSEPKRRDRRIRERARANVIARGVQAEMGKRVRWHEPL